MTTHNQALGTGVILFDPDPLGGFARGAVVNSVPFMLRLGTFTLGTRLTYAGKSWCVQAAASGGQRLAALSAEHHRAPVQHRDERAELRRIMQAKGYRFSSGAWVKA